MYQKRHNTPTIWPIARKGTAYVITPRSSSPEAIPVLIVLREILGIVGTRKEAKRALHNKLVEVNGKVVFDENLGLALFDTLGLPQAKKWYRIIINEQKKFDVKEISQKEADEKVAKIVNKSVIKGNKIQVHLQDGRNYLSTIACSTNDSVLVDLKNKKIVSCVSFKEKSKALVIKGKHIGEEGSILSIDQNSKKIVFVEGKSKQQVEIPLQNIMILP